MQIIQRALSIWERRISLDEYALHLEQDINKSRELLDKMVEDALVLWSIYNVRTENESYITSKKMDECTTWVIKKIITQMTPAILEQLSIAYPCGNDTELIESVKNVAKIHVMQYTIKQNSKDMEDDIPNINIVV